jgi:secondary thiamine-phosphate synthase enzyme
MHQSFDQFTVATRGKGLIEITPAIRSLMAEQPVASGLVTVFMRHTSSSLLIQENSVPVVRADLEAFFASIAHEDPGRYVLRLEGPDVMPAHIRSALTQVQLSLPVDGGRMMLGTWQGIYLFEHRRSPQQRTIVLHLMGR